MVSTHVIAGQCRPQMPVCEPALLRHRNADFWQHRTAARYAHTVDANLSMATASRRADRRCGPMQTGHLRCRSAVCTQQPIARHLGIADDVPAGAVWPALVPGKPNVIPCKLLVKPVAVAACSGAGLGAPASMSPAEYLFHSDRTDGGGSAGSTPAKPKPRRKFIFGCWPVSRCCLANDQDGRFERCGTATRQLCRIQHDHDIQSISSNIFCAD